ncbi:hypothetical protein HMPREF9443_00916 [Phascolarctobacterium succinatutens YIT 12067]|uniref:Secreted protein n=1 Tax=Phascolarctobacterium succinatutens YIT 12067 TaxID=626939 RepID=E8LDI9_9FIRM|nr:hypothetical protein HMPREF9443_00916 [Phascolarctobacterium succinatutens YIT 12067]
MTFLPLFPLSLGGFAFLHAPGAAGAVFPPVGFGDKGRPADRAAFPAPPLQEGCGQLPVKGQDSHTEPAAHEGIGNALDAHARLPVVQ